MNLAFLELWLLEEKFLGIEIKIVYNMWELTKIKYNQREKLLTVLHVYLKTASLYFRRTIRKDFECFHYKEMIHICGDTFTLI